MGKDRGLFEKKVRGIPTKSGNAPVLNCMEKRFMKEKIRNGVRQGLKAVTTAGIIIWLIGLYYAVVKAGIPYQDPPLDLLIRYQVNSGIGDVLMGTGFWIAVCAGAIQMLLAWIGFRRQKNPPIPPQTTGKELP